LRRIRFESSCFWRRDSQLWAKWRRVCGWRAMHAVVSGSVFDPVFRDAIGFLYWIHASIDLGRVIYPIAGIRNKLEPLLYQSVLGIFQGLEPARRIYGRSYAIIGISLGHGSELLWPGLEPGRKFALPLGLPFWYMKHMSKSILSRTGKKIGRPPTGAESVHLRVLPDQSAAIDAWIAKQKQPDLSRPEAIRRLVELGLKAKGKTS
jgi:hypothetical protein